MNKKIELLDKILESLNESETHSLDFKSLNRETYSKYLNRNEHFNNSTFVGLIDSQNEFGNALNFLELEGMVTLDNPNIHLRYKGIIKLSKGGYLQEYKDTSLKNRLNNFFWFAVPTIAFLSFFLSLFNYFGNR